MIRKIIQIDEAKCTGCGLCAEACHEGAIGMINGKAHLLRDDYCDGFGDCLPACPADAISFIEREAAAYDEAAVQARKRAVQLHAKGGCPGSAMHLMQPSDAAPGVSVPSQLRMWPVQIKLCSPFAPYFDGCDLLIAADCTAYAYGNFHQDFIKGHVTLIGCPKLDAVDYTEKLAQILKFNNVRSVWVTRMTVPCCGGLERAVRSAVEQSGKQIPLRIFTIGIDGTLAN